MVRGIDSELVFFMNRNFSVSVVGFVVVVAIIGEAIVAVIFVA